MRAIVVHAGGTPGGRLPERLNVPSITVEQLQSGRAIREEDIVRIWWGSPPVETVDVNESDETLWLNPPERVRRSFDPEWVAESLRIHGIRSARNGAPEKPGGAAHTHRFRVPVFHLEPLSVFRAASNALLLMMPQPGIRPVMEEAGDGPDKFARRAAELAVKAVYLLGLDAAVVDIGFAPDKEPEVIGVDASPSSEGRIGRLFAEAIDRFNAQLRREPENGGEPVLGADPEFLLKNASGKIVPASRYLPLAGEAGCDVMRVRGEVRFPLAELRPRPSADPVQLLRHLHLAMQSAAARIPDDAELQWVAGAMPERGFPLGGHIHLSGVWLNSFLLRALDNYLALPLSLVEGDGARYRKPRFGLPGDFRRKPHGGFEYRTPSSWLASPRAAKAAFALAALIARHYWRLRHRPLNEPHIQRLFYECRKAELLDVVRPLWDEVRRLPDYDRFEHLIAPFERMMFRLESWDEQTDIRAKWKIGPFSAKCR